MGHDQYRYRWRTLLSNIIEASKMRTPSLSTRKTVKPCQTANDIESGSRSDMLQVCFLLSNITRATQTHSANPLGNRPLNAGSFAINLLEFLRLFLLSPLLESEIVGLGTNSDGATWRAT